MKVEQIKEATAFSETCATANLPVNKTTILELKSYP